MLLNCGVGEDSWESLGLQGDPTSPSKRKSVLNINWKDWYWSWSSNTDRKNWLIGKDSDTVKDERQEEKGRTEDEMAGWHHWLDGCKSEWTPGDGDGQGGLACGDSWGRKESDTTERLHFTLLYGFSSGHVWMWELNYKEIWVQKHWCFWTVLLQKTLESPLDCKESQPVHPKGDQSWVCIGRTDAEAKTPILWPPHAESWLIWMALKHV